MRAMCPKCKAVFEIGIDFVGRKVECACGEMLLIEPPPPTANTGGPTVSCKHCGTAMSWVTEDASSQLAGCGLIALGLFLIIGLIAFMPFSTVGGIVVIFYAVKICYRTKKVWVCDHCGYFFESF